jgi:uncharacterized protein (DUF2147 family)
MNFLDKNSGAVCDKVMRVWISAMIMGTMQLGAAVAYGAASSTPVGVWQANDDRTHQPTALVQIVQNSDGTLSGKIIRGLGENNSPERRCTECTDERKDQKIEGMTVVKAMKQENDEWDGGKILDPMSGKEYSCKMHLEASGQKLVLRGYIGFSLLGRSQTWTRYSDASGASVRN